MRWGPSLTAALVVLDCVCFVKDNPVPSDHEEISELLVEPSPISPYISTAVLVDFVQDTVGRTLGHDHIVCGDAANVSTLSLSVNRFLYSHKQGLCVVVHP
jgi:hypothetical protein